MGKTEQIKADIDYVKYVADNIKNDELKKMFIHIYQCLEHYQRITKNHYFYLSDKENEEADKFYDENIRGHYFGANGGGMGYSFVPTSLGNVVKVFTLNHQIEKDITDISCW